MYAGIAGVFGLVIGYQMRRASLRLATVGVVLITVGVFVAGLVGTSRAMFISTHDLGVVTEVVVVAGVVALLFGCAVGSHLVRHSRDLQRRAREFGESGRFTAEPGPAPAELRVLAEELTGAAQRLEESAERERRLEGSRRELVAWVSHDLRTPLAGLRAMAEALEDGMVEDPERYHARIRGEVERMSRMVERPVRALPARGGGLRDHADAGAPERPGQRGGGGRRRDRPGQRRTPGGGGRVRHPGRRRPGRDASGAAEPADQRDPAHPSRRGGRDPRPTERRRRRGGRRRRLRRDPGRRPAAGVRPGLGAAAPPGRLRAGSAAGPVWGSPSSRGSSRPITAP